jgi:hypothetical protein
MAARRGEPGWTLDNPEGAERWRLTCSEWEGVLRARHYDPAYDIVG